MQCLGSSRGIAAILVTLAAPEGAKDVSAPPVVRSPKEDTNPPEKTTQLGTNMLPRPLLEGFPCRGTHPP
jgi:hypothetical protein